jgi:hypothetical protein
MGWGVGGGEDLEGWKLRGRGVLELLRVFSYFFFFACITKRKSSNDKTLNLNNTVPPRLRPRLKFKNVCVNNYSIFLVLEEERVTLRTIFL